MLEGRACESEKTQGRDAVPSRPWAGSRIRNSNRDTDSTDFHRFSLRLAKRFFRGQECPRSFGQAIFRTARTAFLICEKLKICLRDEGGDGVGGDDAGQALIQAAVVVGQLFVIQAHEVEDGGV